MSLIDHRLSGRRWLWGLLTVLGVLVLAGIAALFVAVRNVQIASQRMNDRGYLSQLTIAIHSYHDTYGQLPPPYLTDLHGKPMHSWRVLILPFILGDEGQQLYREYRFDEPWDGPHNRLLASRMPAVFAFHGLEGNGNTTTNFVAVVGRETVWAPGEKMTLDDIPDGLSDTLLIVENHGAGIHWMEPRDLSFYDMDFTVNSPRGISSQYLAPTVAPLDGNTKRLGREITPATIRALLTRNGGEKLQQVENNRWLPLSEVASGAASAP